MSGSVNKVILVGHLGRDPEIRDLNNGGKVASFSMATSDTWRDKATGERRERVEWHNIVIFNEALVGVAERFLKKGSKVYIEGALATRKWEKDGIDRYTTEVVLKAYRGELVLLDKAEGSGRPPASDPDSYGTTRTRDDAPATGGQRFSETIDDDIPF